MSTPAGRSRRAVLGAAASVGVGAVAGCLGWGNDGGPSPLGAWPNRDGDAGNSGANPGSGGPTESPSVRTVLESGDHRQFRSVPVTDGTTLAVWAPQTTLFGVDLGGGEEWRHHLSERIDFWEDAPAIRGGSVYLPTPGGGLTSVAQGEREWSADAPGDPLSSPTVDDSGIYVASREGLTAYDHDGTEQWSITDDRHSLVQPAADGSRVYQLVEERGFPRPPWRLVARRASDGAEVWRQSGYARASAVVVADGRVYATESPSDDLRVVAFAADDGTRLWRSDGLGEAVYPKPAVASDGVYVATKRELYRLDPNDGSRTWDEPYTLPTDEHERPSPRTDGETVYVRLDDHRIVAVAAGTGEERWIVSLEDTPLGGPTTNLSIVDGSIYLTHDDVVELH